MINYLCEPYLPEVKAQRMYEENHNNPRSRYFMMSVDEIITLWMSDLEYCAKRGKCMDDYIGFFTENKTGKTYDEWKEEKKDYMTSGFTFMTNAWHDFWKLHVSSKDYMEYITRETLINFPISDIDHEVLQGVPDMILYDHKRKKLIILDWKTNNNIDPKVYTYNKNIYGPLGDMDIKDTKPNKYTIQVHCYKYMLLNILSDLFTPHQIETYIVHLSPSGLYQIFPEQFDYSNELIESTINYGYNLYKQDPEKYMKGYMDSYMNMLKP